MYLMCFRIFSVSLNAQGSHSQILMKGGGGGGPTELHILYPKKSQLQDLSTQKESLLFLGIHVPPKNPLVLLSQPRNPSPV